MERRRGETWTELARRFVLTSVCCGGIGPLVQPHPGSPDSFRLNYYDGPPAELYLALRIARRGLARNPDDSAAWLLLGQLYFNIANRTLEARQEFARPELI